MRNFLAQNKGRRKECLQISWLPAMLRPNMSLTCNYAKNIIKATLTYWKTGYDRYQAILRRISSGESSISSQTISVAASSMQLTRRSAQAKYMLYHISFCFFKRSAFMPCSTIMLISSSVTGGSKQVVCPIS